MSEIEQETSRYAARIHVALSGDAELRCPECGKACPGYDHRERRWRHTNICDYRTEVVAKVPRVQCPQHGMSTISVPWADARVQFTSSFEACVMDWLHDATSISVIAKRLGVSWTMIAHIMDRGIKRGLERKPEKIVPHICVDETASKKGHNYVTIVSDPATGTVLHVSEGRTIESLLEYYDSCSPEQIAGIESVSMDMWPAYITATRMRIPDADCI